MSITSASATPWRSASRSNSARPRALTVPCVAVPPMIAMAYPTLTMLGRLEPNGPMVPLCR